jgi:cobalt-zinc-cadmium efflux system protein
LSGSHVIGSSDDCAGCESHGPQLHGARGVPGGHGSRGATVTRLRITLALAATYLIAEVIGGWLTNSLALLADAGHMLSDVAALGISLAALQAASLPPTSSRTYGYHRAEALAALVNAVTLCVVAIGISWEAVQRLSDPPEVAAPIAFAIAAGGLLVNIAGLAILGGHHDHGIAVKSAWLHLVGDALGSAGAMISAATIFLFGWYWADPLASLVIAALIVRSAMGLLMETVDVLMERAPQHIDVDLVRGELGRLPGVIGVHDLHVWSIATGLDALSGHVVLTHGSSGKALLAQARTMLHDRFGIEHITLQLEETGEAGHAEAGTPAAGENR